MATTCNWWPGQLLDTWTGLLGRVRTPGFRANVLSLPCLRRASRPFLDGAAYCPTSLAVGTRSAGRPGSGWGSHFAQRSGAGGQGPGVGAWRKDGPRTWASCLDPRCNADRTSAVTTSGSDETCREASPETSEVPLECGDLSPLCWASCATGERCRSSPEGRLAASSGRSRIDKAFLIAPRREALSNGSLQKAACLGPSRFSALCVAELSMVSCTALGTEVREDATA